MRFLVMLFLAVLPVQALALSCLPVSVARTFNEVNAAKDAYVVVAGRLTLNMSKLPPKLSDNTPPPEMTRIPAMLVGKSLSSAGVKLPFEQALTLEVACFGPWCGNVENGQEVLAFVRRNGGKYALGINPCGGHVFINPTRKMLKEVRQCLKGGACKEPEI